MYSHPSPTFIEKNLKLNIIMRRSLTPIFSQTGQKFMYAPK